MKFSVVGYYYSFKSNDMATWKLEDLSKKMKDLDICMLSTQTPEGEFNARPMSNNGEVEYDGNSFFFSSEDSAIVNEIEENNQVSLAFNGKDHVYIAVIGEADLVRDREEMEEHWTKDLDKWFEQGLDTPGVVMIHAKASRIRYWDGEEQGEVPLP